MLKLQKDYINVLIIFNRVDCLIDSMLLRFFVANFIFEADLFLKSAEITKNSTLAMR